MCTEKYVFVKEIFTNKKNMGLSHRVEKTVYGVEIHHSPAKKKFLAQRWVKKLTDFWDMKGPSTIDFLKKKGNCKRCFLFIEWPSYKSTVYAKIPESVDIKYPQTGWNTVKINNSIKSRPRNLRGFSLLLNNNQQWIYSILNYLY